VNREHARQRAEAAFKPREHARTEGLKALEEQKAEQLAVRKRTARLRALRFDRDGTQQ
jgi:hypothetical protein